MTEKEKLSFSQTIIVEGKYDKIKLREFVSSPILATNGFRIFSDPQKRAMISALANSCGIIILTDSDRAGQKIRGYIKGFAQGENIQNVFCPQIRGKERRKEKAGKDGYLGVEGLTREVLLECFQKANLTSEKTYTERYTMADLYTSSIIGENSKAKRTELLERLGLPSYLSTKDLLAFLNSTDEAIDISLNIIYNNRKQ